MNNDKLVYTVVIWVFLGISLWKEKDILMGICYHMNYGIMLVPRLFVRC